MKKPILSILFVVAAVFWLSIFGQNHTRLSSAMQSYTLDNPTHGGVVTYFGEGDSIIDVFVYDPNEEVRVIVQFSSPPLTNYLSERGMHRHAGYEAARTSIAHEQSSFRTALRVIEGRDDAKEHPDRLPVETEIHHEYKLVLNAMALTTRQWVVEEIKELPWFFSVHRDEKVFALLDESVTHIGAEAIWADYGVTGEGIVVGILDTGIDYMHPDLGGGIGEGYKVLGGWDFVNGNADPMDDHSHGTHVAGIVAADGVLKGVAPGASLMAYKVLSAEGYGYNSWIIGGVEQSVADGVHILNASLGGPGNPDDPMSTAIDNASSAGVLCVVAAGNNGPNYYTIDSPGCAHSALTVGATDLYDEIAWFSSRGPESTYYQIKPNVLAPGVETLAPVLNGQFAKYSGTSMATPHVAGAAALLLQQYPNFNPSQLKSIFSHTAIDLGYDVWTQGTGRIDLLKAFELPEVIVEPPKLSMGSVDLTADIWTSTENISVTNVEPVTKSVTVGIAGDFPEGAMLTVTPDSFTLPPQSSKEITLTLEVNNALVPFPETFPASYSDHLAILVDESEFLVPIVFLKNQQLKLLFDEAPMWVIIRGESFFSGIIEWPGNETSIMLPQGLYDIFIQYEDFKTTILKENVEVESFTLLEVMKSEAKNRVTAHNVDENGRVIIPNASLESFNKDNFFVANIYWSPFYMDKHLSDFNHFNWFWSASHTSPGNEQVYVFGDALSACSTDVFQSYEAGDLKRFSFSYPNLDPNLLTFPVTAIKSSIWTSYTYDPYGPPLLYPYTQEFFVSPNFNYSTEEFYFRNYIYDFLGHPFELWHQADPYTSAGFTIDDDGELLAFRSFFNRQYYTFPLNGLTLNENVYRAGLGPPSWLGMLLMHSDRIIVDNLLFLWQKKDFKRTDLLPYRLYRDDVLTAHGNFYVDMIPTWGSYWGSGELLLEPDAYVLEFDLEAFPIHGQQGSTTARLGFDHSQNYGHIPMLKSLNIVSNGIFTDFVGLCQEASIQFSIIIQEHFTAPELVSLEYMPENKSNWTALPLENEDSFYWADIPGTIPEGFVNIRITVEDPDGSFIEYTVNRAFLHAEITLPEVHTVEPARVFGTTVYVDGHVAFDGGATVTERGMVWNKTGSPSIEHNDGMTLDGQGMGSYTSVIGGLEGETMYHARAYATNEYGTAYGEEIQFMTDECIHCPVEQLPFSICFELPTPPDLPDCWHAEGVNSYEANIVEWYSYACNQSYTSARLSHSWFSEVLLITPAIAIETGSVRMRFDLYPDVVTTPANFTVGTMADPSDYNTFIPAKVFELNTLPLEPWLTLEAYFNNLDDPETHFVLKTGDYTKMELGTWFIRGLLIEEIPSCPAPFDLGVDNITASSAALYWSQHGHADSWDVLWGEKGFDPGSEGTMIQNLNQQHYLLDNLELAVWYEIYVRTHCNGETSEWSVPYVFSTTCDFFALPIYEDFNNCILPHLPLCWHGMGEGHYEADVIRDENNPANKHARLYHYHNSYAILATPEVDNDISLLRMRFQTKRYYLTNNTTFYVGTMTDPANIDSFTPVHAFEQSHYPDGEWLEVVAYFDEHNTTDAHLAFKMGDISITQSGYLHINDVTIEEAPSCPEPWELFAENISQHTADLSWMQAGNASHWDILYGESGFDIDSGGTLIEYVEQTNYAITGLEPGVAYEFYVRAHCEEEISAWSLPFGFVMECAPLEMPFVHHFDLETVPHLPHCWNKTGKNHYLIETTQWNYMDEVHVVARLFTFQSAVGILSTPPLGETYPGLKLQAKVWPYTTLFPEAVSVGTISDPNDPYTYQPVKQFDLEDVPNEPWLEIEAIFENGIEPGEHIAFKIGDINHQQQGQLFIYEIVVEELDPEPEEVPNVRVLEDHTLADGETACFDALVSIYLSGPGGPFVVEPGGHVSLIAGEYIIMLPGTYAHKGSILHAYIAPGGPFCSETQKQPPLSDATYEPVDKQQLVTEAPDIHESAGPFFKVYPNPTQDRFTLELLHHETAANFTIEVYNVRGTLIKRRELTANRYQSFSLESQQPGMYFIRVTQETQHGVERLIKR